MLKTYLKSNLVISNFLYLADASIDFLKHYQLVDPNKLNMYAMAYVVEDDDLDYRIDTKVCLFYFLLKIK